ncbi:hypothetical protein LJ655_02335 [Paraburkholderia sp. MMS20-SJTN17]|uniref:Transmembrane protein n=1 Tax=Paraburkholderia translucens TaxID=2886945 RepID=A0ABS8K7M2_9BURK|nr:hypothetical protein [Paraburkholderia sp. MMS20-SJTN17]MCC8400743.1 hypothetical protein [Paraburkholderia sp. MMS20-SJTN17]
MNPGALREHLVTLRFELTRRLGLPGLVAVLLLCVAAVMVDSTVRMRNETRELSNDARPTHAAKKPHATDNAGPRPDAAMLETLPELFPRFARSADDIAVILAHARESDLAIGSADYLVVADSGGPYMRYQMLLPVKDQYGTIRRFLASVLNTVPNAALREIHVERPAVDGNVLDARVRFELVYRSARP